MMHTTVGRMAALLLSGGLLVSCLGDDDESEVILSDYSNATVKSFAMKENSAVAPALSYYAFTIDNLGNSDPDLADEWPGAGIIFNPDSLPVGAVPDSITVEMTYSSPSDVIFYYYDADGTLADSVDFAKNQSVDFATYARTRLHIVARDGRTTKDYFVKVNVHRVAGDTIAWRYVERDVWDTTGVVAQRAERIGSTLFWYVQTADGRLAVRTAGLTTPLGDWSEPHDLEFLSQDADAPAPAAAEADGTAAIDLLTLFGMGDTLYAATAAGDVAWSADGRTWHTEAGRPYLTLLDPALADGVPDGFPVRGFTRPVRTPANPMQGVVTERFYIVGGETADGRLTASTWTFDGTQWAEFPQRQMPAMTGASIVQYTTDTDRPRSLWILWPGLTGKTPTGTLYMSENRGVTWRPLAGDYPDYAQMGQIAPTAAASAFVDETSHWIYAIGGVTADGQSSDVVGGHLPKLTFDKNR